MTNANDYIPERAMFIFAHPDDIEFGSAGTAAKWAKHGCEISYIVLTDGNIGSREAGMTAEKLAKIRRREQSEAAEVAGVARCLFMGEPDGRLQPTLELRKKLVRLIRQHKPNVVVCGDPQFFYSDGYINHPDHRSAGQVALEAVFPSGDSPLLFPELVEEGYEPHKVNYVYISFGRREANMYVDITESIDTKIAALRKHASQLGDWDPEERMREWAADTGKRVGYKYAEGYFRITLREVEEEKEPEPETEIEAQAEAGD
ncbi:PIG-L deacetylase family protein [Candidatus Leptofilum sp.]|uniref:PIG-L deacetylase family protein n=1 Tax=Candidatus Leptofilum sp. TaxID=3241576 RepID=UPI003B599AF8